MQRTSGLRAYLFALSLSCLPAISFAASAPCAAAFDGSKAYLKILAHNLPTRAENVRVTVLIDEVFSPVLKEIARGLNETRPESINFSAPKYLDTQIVKPITQTLSADGLDSGYDGYYAGAFASVALPFQPLSLLKAPFTRFNKSIMSRLEIVMRVVGAYIDRHEGELRDLQSFATSSEILKERTFGGAQLAFSMKYGNESILYAVAMLTASPLGQMTPEDLFRAVIEPQGGRPSLVAQLALALPPNFLGVYGGQNFIHDPLVFSDNGRPILSPNLKQFLKNGRGEMAQGHAQKYELGLGCPVARGALPDYLAAITRIYFEWPR